MLVSEAKSRIEWIFKTLSSSTGFTLIPFKTQLSGKNSEMDVSKRNNERVGDWGLDNENGRELCH